MAAKNAENEAAAPPPVIAEQMALDREQRRNERQSLVAIPAQELTSGAPRTTFMPQNMGEAMQFAGLMARSNFVPMSLRGKDGDCMAIVMQAARWGMDPFAVANKAYFVKDGAPPAFEAQLVNAVVNSSGALSSRLRIEFEGEDEKLRCTVTGWLRADPNDPKVKTQSIARITTRNSPLWKADPQQQLAYYTTRAWARLHCPEVLMGVYTPDEIDLDPERARVVSPPMPRRDSIPDLGGERARVVSPPMPRRDSIPDLGGEREEEDEETARALDAQTYAEREGRADEEHGDQGDGTDEVAASRDEPHPGTLMATDMCERLGVRELMIGTVMSIEAELAEHKDGMFEGDAARVQLAIDNARLRLGKPAKVAVDA